MPDRMTGKIGTHMAHPGLGPYAPEDKRTFHSYYQWVPFMLFFQVRLTIKLLRFNYSLGSEIEHPEKVDFISVIFIQPLA